MERSDQLDQDEYIKTMRPIVHPDLTGSKPEDLATKPVNDQFVSLRGALAYATITQAWIQVYVVSLQRVINPTNLDVRRLNAVVRKLQQSPQKVVYPRMTCKGELDLHTDSGYRRMTGEADDDIKGYGMRGTNVLRRGKTKDGKDLWFTMGIRDPVVPLVKALYGHPDAGGYWENHCNDHLAKVGFVSVDNLPSIFWHRELPLLLMVYVDDFKWRVPRLPL